MEIIKKKLKNRKFLTRFIFIMLISLAVIALAVYQLLIVPRLSKDNYIYKETKVERGDIVLGIEESGTVTLEASELDYNLTIEDDDEDDDDDDEDEEETSKNLEIEEVYVSQGQRITEGEALFKLSDSSVASVRRLLESNQAEAKIALAEAKEEYNIGVLQAENTKKETNVTASDASTLYNATVSGLKAEISGLSGEIEALTAEIEDLQADLADEELLDSLNDAYLELVAAQNTFNDSDDVQNYGAYTANTKTLNEAQEAYDKIKDQMEEMQEQIEDDQKKIAEDQTSLSQAQAALAVKEKEAENTYNSSVSNGQMAEDVYTYSVNSLEEAVQEAQTDLDEAETNLNAFTDFVGDDGIIYANGSGIVTAVNYEAGDELKETGAMVSYAKEDAFSVSIDVSEEDITSVKVGDSVTLKFSAYDDKTWDGKVSAITTSVSDNHTTTVSYPVTIEILGDTSTLYGGMTADVTFVTDSVSNVLYVSKQAVIYEDDQAYVYVKSGNEYTKKAVETGFSNGSSIEIKEGLSEGDEVYIKSRVGASESELRDSTESGSDNDMEFDPENMENGDFENGSPGNMDQMPSFDNMPGGFPGSDAIKKNKT